MPFTSYRSLRAFAVPAIAALWMLTGPMAASATSDPENTQWKRYPAISPDGTALAFSWRGDLWTVPASGGQARILTTHEAYEAWPVWSPDSQTLAFASDRHGQLDIFTVPAAGGAETRLTFHSSDDLPTSFTSDGSRLFFTSDRQHAPQALLGSGAFGELYSIPLTGGRALQELTTPADRAKISADGKRVVYEEVRAYENRWRKHHTSSASRDLWIWDRETGRHLPLASYRGEDREPIWTADGTGVVYLSERDGVSNIWQTDVDETGVASEPRQITRHSPHPVRFLSTAADGTLAYGYDGDLWLKPLGEEPRKVEVRLSSGERENTRVLKVLTKDATEMAVSPLGDELAFVVRGEIFVASAEHGTTRRLTSTPEQERSVSWAPDGRTLYFAAERDRAWNLYSLSLALEEEERLFEATKLDEKEVLVGEAETFQPVVSPDGKTLAFLHNRDELRVLDLESGEQKTLIPAERNYSYIDGDRTFRFSPDGRWLTATYVPYERWIDELAVIETATGRIHNVTQSGYSEFGPRFSADGTSLYYASDRFGMRSHGSWGSQADVFAIALNRQAWDRSRLSEEAFERLRRKEKKEKEQRQKAAKNTGGSEADEGEIEEGQPIRLIDPVDLELEDLDHRTRRMTLFPSNLSDFVVSRDGETIFFVGQTDDDFELWMVRPRSKETRRLASVGSRSGSLELSNDGKKLFLLTGEGTISRLDVGHLVETSSDKKSGNGGDGSGGGKQLEPVAFKAEMRIDTVAERHAMFEHVWRQVQRKFYVEDLHGADWPALKASYGRFLDDIREGRDFAELLSELLGELNASHTGGRFRPVEPAADKTASLGILYDPAHRGLGLKISEILKRGPGDRSESRLGPGITITHIDGVELSSETNPWALLNHKEGKRVRLDLLDEQGEAWQEVIEPIPGGEERGLRYERWVERLRAKTEELSGGRVGYVHVRSMNDASFRRFYQDTLGRMSDKEALIVDTRWNGGGWLHDDLAAFLQGRDYLRIVPRGKEPGSFGAESIFRWTRPVAVLQNEANYSDGHIFPWVFKELELGPLVGMPVAGTGTAVWWERLIDQQTVFGIPQVGMLDPRGEYMENQDLIPDVQVQNTPESIAAGEDLQLKAAVDALLK